MISHMIEPSTIRRLAFIKYLYGIGIEQSKAPELLASASLLTFHDAVELFLQVASEHLNTGTNKPSFMDYWKLISEKLPTGIELAQQESMRRLNKARVALKHHGTLPSSLDVEALRASTTSFFHDNTPVVFELEFEHISLIDFVRPEAAQNKLRKAEELLDKKEFKPALKEVAISFAEVLDDYEERKRVSFGRSPFFFGNNMGFFNSFYMDLDSNFGSTSLSRYIDTVSDSISSMQTAIKMLALGIDYRKYSKFQIYTPHVARVVGGTYYASEIQHINNPTKEDAQFCIDFVVEAAIRLQEFDYDVIKAS